MNTAQVDRQLTVDEDPNIVVPGERKRLAARRSEFRVDLSCKLKVSEISFIAKSQSVDRELRSVDV